MKINFHLRFPLLAIFIFSTFLVMGQSEKPYTGYRVYLADLKILKQDDKMIKIAFRTINTGRQDLEFGQGNTESMQKMVVRFDPMLEKGKMQPHLNDIISSLKRQEFAVVAGMIGPHREMEVDLTMANSGAAPAPSEIISEASSSSDPIAESNPVISTKPVESEPVMGKEIVEREEVETVVETVSETTTDQPTEDNVQYYDPESCPDLKIEAIKVLKQKKNFVVIEYTIKNIGKGPANIEGTSKHKDDNIAVKAFMTSSSKLTKGALVLGGDMVGNRSKNAGPLLPGESHTAKIRLDLNTMTKFTPVIILELDTFGQLRECDKTNNKNHIKVR